MALTIETGAGVPNADSYVTVQAARDYASSRGLPFPTPDADAEVLLRRACDYLDTLEEQYKGARTTGTQPLAWPRLAVIVFGEEVADDSIPDQLKRAQCQLACDAKTTSLMPNGTGREVLRTKVDVIETEYAKSGSGTVTPELNQAMAILAPLLESNGLVLRTVRV